VSDRTPALLALDAGTTGITALVVDEQARVRARGYREFPQHFPADGWVEHDLGQMWSATVEAVREALSVADPLDLELVAVGLTNQRETVCLWDRETLGASRRAIVWQDRRSSSICEAMRDAGHEPLVSARTGLRLDPYFSATKLTWIRENEPNAWSQVESGRSAVGTVDSYLVARMSRGVHHITDHTNASRTLLYDLAEGGWSPELADLFGVPIDALPEVVPSYGRLARTDPTAFLGLDLPITGIAGDQQAALVGQAGFEAGAAKCTYGTGSFLLAHTGTDLRRSDHGLLTTVATALASSPQRPMSKHWPARCRTPGALCSSRP
jgi:glycerol kinase